tara:strand:- start:4174 stop:4365 length:192 start_codon:yes stop_codon:yes gene_type:complete
MTNPNNVPEMLRQAAHAAETGDLERLQDLRDLNHDWMQTEEEESAMTTLLVCLESLSEDAMRN